jgi:hypothetical protein
MEAIHVSLSSGKTNPMSHHVASRDEEEEAIHLSLIVGNNLLSHVEVAAEEEIIISLSCGNDPLSHVEAKEEEAAIISLTFSLSLSLSLSLSHV